ncbi:hypothetical protein [Celerinatantimonas yamalensis]|uniref:Uncharacterized protein n=1 Tax=Celerinatantimonas yamalensis TaxID=559956 RepID=A0ABW9GAZ6_9GAMM
MSQQQRALLPAIDLLMLHVGLDFIQACQRIGLSHQQAKQLQRQRQEQ